MRQESTRVRRFAVGVGLGLWLVARPALAGSAATGDCGPGTVKVCGTVTVKNTSGAEANDFHFYMYQNDRPSVQVMGATVSSAGCDSMSISLGTDNGTPTPPPGNHGASVSGSSCTPIPPGGTISMQVCLCMNERNCIKFKDTYFTSDGTPLPPGGGGGGGPPAGGWRILRPYKGGGGGSRVPGGSGGQGAQEDDGGSGNWIHMVCIENDDTRWVVLEELKLLASMTSYANADTDIDWAGIEPVADVAGRPPVCIPPGGRWCFPFETIGSYVGGHIYQRYKIRPEHPGECSGISSVRSGRGLLEDADNSMLVVGDHPPETPLTEVLDIADYLDGRSSNDYYRTIEAAVTFGGGTLPAIPAGFFGPGSEPFTGTVLMKGMPVDPTVSHADTIVGRHGEAYLPSDGSGDTIPIELRGMSLVSVSPITVTYQESHPLWFDVFVPSSQTHGTQTIKANLSKDDGLSILGVRETSPVDPTPPDMMLLMLASDLGGEVGGYGPQAALEVFFQPTISMPVLPPISGASVRCRITSPSGLESPFTEPPTVQYSPSFFDVLFAVSLDGLSTSYHHIQGSIPPEQPLQFQLVEIVSQADTSSFDLAFVLQASGATVFSAPIIRMLEDGGAESVSSELFDVSMNLDADFPATGSMTIVRDSPNGGTFTSTLQVRPMFAFAPIGGGPATPPLPGVSPYVVHQKAPHGWQYAPPAFPIFNSGPNFFPAGSGPVEWEAADGSVVSVGPAFPPEPFGHPVTFTCSEASPGSARIEVLPTGEVLDLVIPSAMNAEQKRDHLVSTLVLQQPQYYPTTAGTDAFTLNGFLPGTSIRFATGTSAEAQDKLTTAGTRSGQIAFAGSFEPYDGHHQPAVFTAGIVTDVGELTALVSAQELGFQTDGPIICQALFQRLGPMAPPHGAQIQCAGDRLEVYFDPAYTVARGGVVFGTTSPTDGCSGQVVISCHPADSDCDGDVDLADVFVLASCASGPAVPVSPGCAGRDLDDDNDVDQSDFGIVQGCYSGSNKAADPQCVD
ncbi:MAG TPA: hypothetical protein PKY77_22475 [Phycisphaerae bacterium]|nr:hypothetical protein [Phycisphaerae bacterium]HRY66402.1 hypothetical protein [Phycisphaerae bacterium]HSA25891.1 hypothetical protein [Phycisphaerae bacterium]